MKLTEIISNFITESEQITGEIADVHNIKTQIEQDLQTVQQDKQGIEEDIAEHNQQMSQTLTQHVQILDQKISDNDVAMNNLKNEVIQLKDNAENSATQSYNSSMLSSQKSNEAEQNATNAQLRMWEAEAMKKTSESFANEDQYQKVKIYSSNGDGTFSYVTVDQYSAKHWSEQSEDVSGGALLKSQNLHDIPDINEARTVLDVYSIEEANNNVDNKINTAISDLDYYPTSEVDSRIHNKEIVSASYQIDNNSISLTKGNGSQINISLQKDEIPIKYLKDVASYQNNWDDFSNDWLVTISKTSDGIVHIQGLIHGGANNTVIVNLPQEYKPINGTKNKAFVSVCGASHFIAIYLFSDGRLYCTDQGTRNDTSWVTLDVSYSTREPS